VYAELSGRLDPDDILNEPDRRQLTILNSLMRQFHGNGFDAVVALPRCRRKPSEEKLWATQFLTSTSLPVGSSWRQMLARIGRKNRCCYCSRRMVMSKLGTPVPEQPNWALPCAKSLVTPHTRNSAIPTEAQLRRFAGVLGLRAVSPRVAYS
jgi:hypothetical protein